MKILKCPSCNAASNVNEAVGAISTCEYCNTSVKISDTLGFIDDGNEDDEIKIIMDGTEVSLEQEVELCPEELKKIGRKSTMSCIVILVISLLVGAGLVLLFMWLASGQNLTAAMGEPITRRNITFTLTHVEYGGDTMLGDFNLGDLGLGDLLGDINLGGATGAGGDGMLNIHFSIENNRIDRFRVWGGNWHTFVDGVEVRRAKTINGQVLRGSTMRDYLTIAVNEGWQEIHIIYDEYVFDARLTVIITPDDITESIDE